MMKNPHGLSVTRDSDVTRTEWPMVTQAGFGESLRRYEPRESGAPVEEIKHLHETVNLGVESLVLARAFLANCKLRMKRAVRLNERKDVKLRLLSLIADVEQIEKRFPLSVAEELAPLRAEREKGFVAKEPPGNAQ